MQIEMLFGGAKKKEIRLKGGCGEKKSEGDKKRQQVERTIGRTRMITKQRRRDKEGGAKLFGEKLQIKSRKLCKHRTDPETLNCSH